MKEKTGWQNQSFSTILYLQNQYTQFGHNSSCFWGYMTLSNDLKDQSCFKHKGRCSESMWNIQSSVFAALSILVPLCEKTKTKTWINQCIETLRVFSATPEGIMIHHCESHKIKERSHVEDKRFIFYPQLQSDYGSCQRFGNWFGGSDKGSLKHRYTTADILKRKHFHELHGDSL